MDSGSLLDKLPPEVRNKIYRYLLSTTYTKIMVDASANGPSYSMIIKQLQSRHRYNFHTNILCTNHRIFYEARAIFRRNLFVRIITKVPISIGPVPVLCGRRAKDFGDVAMTITYEDGLNNDGEELFAIFAMEDLRLLCQIFNSFHETGRLQSVAFKVVIHGSSEVRGQELDHTHTLSLLHSRQLLEPLTELYAIARFTISGPVNEDYKVKIINQIARPAPRHEDSLEMIRELWIQGEAALNGNRVAFAQKKYIAAILQLESRDWGMSMIKMGRYANQSRYTVYCKLLHGLLHWLAFTFSKMGIFGKAHHWASLALHSMVYVSSTISHPPAQYVALAGFMAKTSIALGERHRALWELSYVLHFEPNNARVKDEMIRLYGEVGTVPGLPTARML